MKKIYEVKTLSYFVHTYFIEADNDVYAKDTVVCNIGKETFNEAIQEHIDENIISCRQISDETEVKKILAKAGTNRWNFAQDVVHREPSVANLNSFFNISNAYQTLADMVDDHGLDPIDWFVFEEDGMYAIGREGNSQEWADEYVSEYLSSYESVDILHEDVTMNNSWPFAGTSGSDIISVYDGENGAAVFDDMVHTLKSKV